MSVIPASNTVVLGASARHLPAIQPAAAGLSQSPVTGGSVYGKRSFTYDEVYNPETRQKEFYDGHCSSLIEQFVDGFNVTVFA